MNNFNCLCKIHSSYIKGCYSDFSIITTKNNIDKIQLLDKENLLYHKFSSDNKNIRDTIKITTLNRFDYIRHDFCLNYIEEIFPPNKEFVVFYSYEELFKKEVIDIGNFDKIISQNDIASLFYAELDMSNYKINLKKHICSWHFIGGCRTQYDSATYTLDL
jgi:hypothetical protein